MYRSNLLQVECVHAHIILNVPYGLSLRLQHKVITCNIWTDSSAATIAAVAVLAKSH